MQDKEDVGSRDPLLGNKHVFQYNTKNQMDSYPSTLTTIANIAGNEHDSTINHLVQHGFKLEGTKYNKHKAKMGGSAYVDFAM